MKIALTKVTPLDMLFGFKEGKPVEVDSMFIAKNNKRFDEHYVVLAMGKPFPVMLDQAVIVEGDIDDLPDEKLFMSEEKFVEYLQSYSK